MIICAASLHDSGAYDAAQNELQAETAYNEP